MSRPLTDGFAPAVRSKRTTGPRTKRAPRITNPDGVSENGVCLACGKTVRYWIHYQLCDFCLSVTAPTTSNAG